MNQNTTPRTELSLFISGYCGPYYGIEDQKAGECDSDFQRRVSGLLRSRGHLAEAHEVIQGGRFDSEDKGSAVLDGIMGACSIALNGSPYGANTYHLGDEAKQGESIVGDEYVAGSLIRHQQEHPGPPLDAMLLAMGIDPSTIKR
jgi:hypothetical protein